MFHAIFTVRYLHLTGSIIYGLLTLAAVYYSFSRNDIEDPSFTRLFKPLTVVALVLIGGTSMAVSMLSRELQNGGAVSNIPVVPQTVPNTLEILMWVADGTMLANVIAVLGVRGIFGREMDYEE
jgi:hypothetical protein